MREAEIFEAVSRSLADSRLALALNDNAMAKDTALENEICGLQKPISSFNPSITVDHTA